MSGEGPRSPCGGRCAAPRHHGTPRGSRGTDRPPPRRQDAAKDRVGPDLSKASRANCLDDLAEVSALLLVGRGVQRAEYLARLQPLAGGVEAVKDSPHNLLLVGLHDRKRELVITNSISEVDGAICLFVVEHAVALESQQSGEEPVLIQESRQRKPGRRYLAGAGPPSKDFALKVEVELKRTAGRPLRGQHRDEGG